MLKTTFSVGFQVRFSQEFSRINPPCSRMCANVPLTRGRVSPGGIRRNLPEKKSGNLGNFDQILWGGLHRGIHLQLL